MSPHNPVNNFCHWINEKPRNITLFLGAGFSMAWDKKFPKGTNLFQIKRHDWEMMPHLATFIEENYIQRDSVENEMDFGKFKNLVYQIGMYKKYPDIRSKYIDDANVYLIEKQLRALVIENFINIAPMYYLDEQSKKIKLDFPKNENQKNIHDLFERLFNIQKKNNSDIPLSVITTNYDYIAEYIFECLDNGYRNSHFYRGFSPLEINGIDMGNPRYSHSNYPIQYSTSIFKINGGFEIFEKGEGFVLDYRNKDFHEWCINPPTIMLPSREQDYSQLYFKMIFPKVVRELRESDTLIIVGYSLSEEDALLHFIVKQFAESYKERKDKKIFHITRSESGSNKTKDMLEVIFPNSDEFITFYYDNDGFNDWIKQVNEKWLD